MPLPNNGVDAAPGLTVENTAAGDTILIEYRYQIIRNVTGDRGRGVRINDVDGWTCYQEAHLSIPIHSIECTC